MSWEAGAAIGGDIAGALIGGAFSAKQASKNRAFQERMANTQYQRAAKDLEKAGLNRVLAIGSPAPTTSGAQAAHPGPTPGSTGIAAASAKENIKVMQDQRTLLAQQAFKALGEGRLAHAEADKAEFTRGIYKHMGPELEKALQRFMPSVSGRLNDGLNLLNDPVDYFMNSAKDKVKETPLYMLGDYLKGRFKEFRKEEHNRRFGK